MFDEPSQIYLFEPVLESKKLEIYAFYDLDFFPVASARIKNYIALGDAFSGSMLVRWKACVFITSPAIVQHLSWVACRLWAESSLRCLVTDFLDLLLPSILL